MRKLFCLVLAILMAFVLCVPSLAEADDAVTPDVLDALIELQPLGVLESNYIEPDISMYNYLQGILQNNTQIEIASAMIAFAAWDGTGQPVKINSSSIGISDTFVARVNYGEINLLPGATFGETSGLAVYPSSGIASCKAIVVSYDGVDGSHWENPYFLNWCEMYEQQPLDATRTVNVPATAEELAAARDLVAERLAAVLTTDEMLAEIEKQPVRVINTAYSKDTGTMMAGDMLQAILKNDSQDTIQSAVIAFVAWDAEGQPVEVRNSLEEFIHGDYSVRLVNYSDINLAPGGTYGNNGGVPVDPDLGIEQIKAIVYSYTTTSGETWENPHVEQWFETYVNKPLEVADPVEAETVEVAAAETIPVE